ncbi:MAG: FG-GAP-like repeat-containing protein [Candidatus Acidiferrales bacterium]
MSQATIRIMHASSPKIVLTNGAMALVWALAMMLGAQSARAQTPPPAAPPGSASSSPSPQTNPSPTSSAAQALPTLPAPDPRKAREAYQEGRRAEMTQNWQAAYDAETEAAEYAPDNKEYQLRRYLDRFALVQQFTDRAERERIDGQLSTARQDLLQALELDPGYSVAQERLQELDSTGPLAEATSTSRLADLPQIRPQPGTHGFDFRGQTRGAYEEVARQFGLIAQFDTDLPDRPVRLRLDPVDFATIMKILGAATHTFWRPMDSRTFFVADDTAAKRRDFDPEIERSFVLPDSITPEDMNETVRLIREIAGVNRAELDTGSRRITLRDTPEHVALAEALLGQIEQPRGELLLEIEILEVDRSLTRQIGVSPPTTQSVDALSESEAQQLQTAAANGTLLQTIESIFTGLGLASATGGASAVIPAVIAFGGGKSIFFAPLPSATANFSETISAVHSAQRLLLRAEDGQKVSFFSGARFPVSLAELSANQSVSPTVLGNGALSGTLPTANYATGAGPAAVIEADFNADGHPDLATANETANTISILLNNGDGTFAANVDYPVGTGPAGLASADFNGDGHADLAVANLTSNTISILLGNGDGTFQPATALTTGAGPIAIATGVFNTNNGNTDLAVVNQTAGTVSIFLGNGDGTFAPSTDYPVGTSPSAIVVGDFNADGKLDLAVTNKGSNTVSVLLGNGDGTFGPKTDYATGVAPSGVATADFNLDDHPDLAVSNETDGTVSILLGNGDGTFAPQTAVTAGADPTSLANADFNNDGKPDLVVTNGSANTISIILGNGDGTFLTPLAFATSNDPVSVAAVDFNADDLTDVAVAAESANEVTVILNSTTVLGQSTQAFVPYPSATYVNLGLGVHATARLNGADAVTLELQFEISSLAGQSINGIPILSDRTIEQTVRLRENQTSIISGIVQSNESGTISGWPWVSQASAIGALTSNNNQQNSETDLLVLVTPREVRLAQHPDQSIYAGAGEPTTGGSAGNRSGGVPSPANLPTPAQIIAPTPAANAPATTTAPAGSNAPAVPSPGAPGATEPSTNPASPSNP